jgi:hypothetical protein
MQGEPYPDNGITEICYNKYVWFAIGPFLQASTDGKHWTYNGATGGVSSVLGYYISGLAWIPWVGTSGIWLAGGYGPNTTLAYTNTVNSDSGWQAIAGTASTLRPITSIACNSTTVVLTYQVFPYIQTTTNPTQYSSYTNASGLNFTACYKTAWNGAQWVAVGTGSSTIAYSLNGQSWTPVANSNSLFGIAYAITWDGMQWIAGGTGGPAPFAVSPDGINWISQSYGIFRGGTALCTTAYTIPNLAITKNGALPPGTNTSISYNYYGTNRLGDNAIKFSYPQLLSCDKYGNILMTQTNVHSVLVVATGSSNQLAIKTITIEQTVPNKSVSINSINISPSPSSSPTIKTSGSSTSLPFTDSTSTNPYFTYTFSSPITVNSITITASNPDAIQMCVLLYDTNGILVSNRLITSAVLSSAGCRIYYDITQMSPS